jgi:predicted transcriptional regulator
MTHPAQLLHLPEEIDTRLDEVSARTNRPKAALLREAVTEYLDQIDWRTREIEAALAEADARVFISHEAILKWAADLSPKAGSSAPDDTSD